MKVTVFKCIVVFFAVFLPITGCSKDPSVKQKNMNYNVLLVTLDTTRTEHLSCYGYRMITSPHIDEFARQGIKFDLAVAQSAATPVSHASILTGLNPYQHGVRVIYGSGGFRLAESIPTIATALREAGWHTAAFLSSFTVSEFYGLDKGFDTFDNGLEGQADDKMKQKPRGGWGWGLRKNQRRSDKTTDRVLEWLGKSSTPFFVWVHYWDPHDAALIPPPEVLSTFMPDGLDRKKRRSSIDHRVALYDAEIFYMDSQLGRVIQSLKKGGQYDNTIVIVVGDHGQGLDDGLARHGWYAHRILYQEQIRIPMILRFPHGPEGLTVPDLVRSVDIYPTVMEILGLPVDKPIEGRSLLGLVNNEPEAPRVAYADALNLYDLNANRLNRERPKDGILYCVMNRSWKLIYRPRHPSENELFHLDTDPLETNNVYLKETSRARKMKKMLESFEGYGDTAFDETPTDTSVMETLRSLGYAGGTPASDSQ